MVPHVSNNAPRALLRAYFSRTSCRATRACSSPHQTGSHTPRHISRPFSSSAPALILASPPCPIQSRWLDANGASLSRSRRGYATASSPNLPSDIAVLGGGLTGLTTAYYLTRFNPDAKITIYESQARVGGWIDTEQVEVTTLAGTDETISFERGARVVSPQTTLTRYEDFVLYDLVWKPYGPASSACVPCPMLILTCMSDCRA